MGFGCLKRAILHTCLSCILIWFCLFTLANYGLIVSSSTTPKLQSSSQLIPPTGRRFLRSLCLRKHGVRLQPGHIISTRLPAAREHHLPCSRHHRHLLELQLPRSQRLSDLVSGSSLCILATMQDRRGIRPCFLRWWTHRVQPPLYPIGL